MATWKKVLVSGSAIDGTTLNIDGAVTLANSFSTGDSADQVLVLDADNSVKVVAQSNIAGITTSQLRITGSSGNDTVNAANSESIVFSGDITSTIGTSNDENGSPSTTIALNLPGGIVSASQITGTGADAISTAISGAFVGTSASLAANIATNLSNISSNDTDITALQNLQSGLLLGSSSFANSASIVGTANEVEVTANGAQGITIGLPDDVHIEGDAQITGSLIVSESITANTLTLLGLSLIDNQTAVISGSNQFGDDVTDTHGFSGSVAIVGSLTASNVPTNNSIVVTDLVGTLSNGEFVNAGTGIQTQISGAFVAASASIATAIENIQVNEAAGIAINTNGSDDAAFSIGVNGTASFEASGTGLTVDNASGVVTYTIAPTTLVNSVGSGTNMVVSSSAQIDEYGFLQVEGDGVLSSSEQLPDGIISGAAQLPDGIISGAAQLPDGVISGSITSTTQGQIIFPGQGTVNLQDLQTGDSPQFTNLTVTGNLTVQGDTTSISTTNLEVEDQFILLNSQSLGATTADKDGGIIVDFGGGSGSGFIYDAVRKAWGVLGADHAGAASTFLASDTVSSEAAAAVNATHIVTVVSSSTLNPLAANGTSITPAYGDGTAKSNLGNMHVNSSDGAIWIYS